MSELLHETLKRIRRRKGYGDLLQHDSSPHQWRPREKLQILALTIDDADRLIAGAGFLEAETTFAYLAHVREILQLHADGLILFAQESLKAGDINAPSKFRRAPGCLGVVHLVAKGPQSTGKVERQFDFWQKRLPPLVATESVGSREQASELLASQLQWYHQNHVSRTPEITPLQAVDKSLSEVNAC